MEVVTLAGAAAGAWAVTCLTLRTATAWFERPSNRRPNYRGVDVPASVGIVLLPAVVLAAIMSAALGWGGVAPSSDGLAVSAAAAAMGLLGWIDDRSASGSGGGVRGHVVALVHGRVTTGLVKAAGGGVVGLGAAAAVGHRGWWIAAAGVVAALTTNMVNLFDLRPGRATKVWWAGAAALLAARPSLSAGVALAAVAAGSLALVPRDLSERAMLGDAGANLMGAALGVAAAASLDRPSLLVSLAVLVALTAASEVVSFGTIIERVGVLRAIDRAGRGPG